MLPLVSHESGKPVQLTSQTREASGDVLQYEGAIIGDAGLPREGLIMICEFLAFDGCHGVAFHKGRKFAQQQRVSKTVAN